MPPAAPSRTPRWEEATRRADALSNIYAAPPIPIVEIAEENGVEVVLADFRENRDRVAGICDFERAKIFVNVADIPVRRRFTIAHELGHWLLHRDIHEANPQEYRFLPRFQRTDGFGLLEQEANRFAAHLLVPSRLLREVAGVAPASELAEIFRVSRTMMEHRIQNVRR